MDWLTSFLMCGNPIELEDNISDNNDNNLNQSPEQIRMNYKSDILSMNQKLLIKLSDMSFSKSYSDQIFEKCEGNEKIIQDVLGTWFDEEQKPKFGLFVALSKLSKKRRKSHEPEWFENHLSSVRFHYQDKQIVPYRYSVH